PKPCTPRELVARLRAILRRAQPGSDGGPIEAGQLALWPEKRRVQWRGNDVHLTSIEFNVLEVLMRNAGRVVSKQEISETALGRPLAPSAGPIDGPPPTIRRKPAAAGRLTRPCRGLGSAPARQPRG